MPQIVGPDDIGEDRIAAELLGGMEPLGQRDKDLHRRWSEPRGSKDAEYLLVTTEASRVSKLEAQGAPTRVSAIPDFMVLARHLKHLPTKENEPCGDCLGCEEEARFG